MWLGMAEDFKYIAHMAVAGSGYDHRVERRPEKADKSMPTSLSSLFFFLMLMLPGFAYRVGRERSGFDRKTTAFRESVSIIAASVASEFVVLILFAVIRIAWPSVTPDVGRLIRGGGDYLRGHYAFIGSWAGALLASATVLAYVSTLPSVRRIALHHEYSHPTALSGWGILFEFWRKNRRARVGCMLSSGAYIEGEFASYNSSADESPDREIIIKAPIKYRAPGTSETIPYPVSAACVAAREIVLTFVTYRDPPLPQSDDINSITSSDQGSPATLEEEEDQSASMEAGRQLVTVLLVHSTLMRLRSLWNRTNLRSLRRRARGRP
jgi:Family of unknown function (DUF6338)